MPKRRRKPTAPKIHRFDKARALVSLDSVKIIKQDKSGRIINAFVAGSAAKTYEVIARREGRNYIETECMLQTGGGAQECKGSWSSVCYHALAVLLTSAKQNGYTAAICESEQGANRRMNLGGSVFQVKSKHALDKPLWIVSNPIQPVQPDLPKQPDSVPIAVEESPADKSERIKKELGF